MFFFKNKSTNISLPAFSIIDELGNSLIKLTNLIAGKFLLFVLKNETFY